MYFSKKFVNISCAMCVTAASFLALPAAAAASTASSTAPVQLVIPSVHINARIDTLGITRTGNMAAPNNFSDAGWYEYGPQPGDLGNAIIDGHYESGPNAKKVTTAGVFHNLNSIQAGDDIEVLSSDGTAHHFTVASVALMSKDASMAPVMASNGTSRLVIITCAGTWLPQQDTFSQRLIVTAVSA